MTETRKKSEKGVVEKMKGRSFRKKKQGNKIPFPTINN